jgi:acetylglutamate kinase
VIDLTLMEQRLGKARILVEALPYIQKISGKTIVIKYGGHAMIDPVLKESVIMDVLLLHTVGIRPVVVHGGGPEINAMLEKVGIESQFVKGLRVTDAQTMEIAQMVLLGKLNTEMVSLLNRFGGKGVGLSGKDAQLLRAAKKPMQMANNQGEMEIVDLGYVGEIQCVTPDILHTLLEHGYIPVISPVASGENGETYNVNADTAAGKVAEALQADKLLLLTDVSGILRDVKDPNSLIPTISREEVAALVEQGILFGGMLPKVECAVSALEGGVGSVHILDGRQSHAILLELFTDGGIGTMFV